MALTQVKTLGIADDAVTEAKVANDAISPTEMKAGTDGHIITYDASGNPTTVGPGTDGQVLTSTGAGSPPAFETLPTSGATLSGSTDNTVVTVTGANAMQGEANLTYDGTTLKSATQIQVEGGSGDTELKLHRTNAAGSDGNTFGNIKFTDNNNNEVAGIRGQRHSAVDDANLTFLTRPTGGSATERLRVTSDGKVGVGVTNPSGLLHITGDDNSNGPEVYLTVNNNNTTDNIGALWFGNNVDKSLVKLAGHTHTANNTADFTVSTSNAGTPAERLRIDATGSIGVNETSPSFSGFGSDGGGIELDDVNSSFTAVKISHGSADMYLASVGSAAYISTRTDHEIVVEKNSTEVARFNDNGLKVPNGKGIDFSATADATSMSSELLDDYEEGTFVPTLGGSNIGTYSVNGVGKYTKVGRIVHVEFRFEGVDLSNSSVNQSRITGWPYAFNLTTTRPQCASLMMNNVVLTTSHDEHTYVFYAETTTELRGLISRDDAGWSGWDITDFQSSSLWLEGTFSYHT